MKPVNGPISRSLLLVLLLLVAPFAAAQQAPPAVFSLQAEFDTPFLTGVDVELVCSDGTPQRQAQRLEPGPPIDLRVSGIEGVASCQVLATVPEGYSVRYGGRGGAVFKADRNGCQYAGVAAGQNNVCRVRITQDPVSIIVYKKWIGASGEEPDVRISLDCEGGVHGEARYINEGSPDGWQVRGVDPEGVLCNVYEAERETYRPDIIDCQGLLIRPGKGEECTMVNTKIVKRIETLNRYGRVIMIAVMLIAGLIAVRRFV